MVVDKIENADIYSGIHKKFKLAFDFLKNTDFSKLSPGKYEVDGEEVFALVNEYETKEVDDSTQLEAHKEYIDIQFMSSGSEKIGVAIKFDQLPVKEYNKKDDYHLFNENYNFISLKKGMFGIFYPDDLHLPGVKNETIELVKKVVVKVKL